MPMIMIFTDFGTSGPYTGQMMGVLRRIAPGVDVIELMSDAPTFNPKASAYLLAALASDIPEGTILLGVVDPGVGGNRRAVVVEAGGRWFVGPDNGLFAIVARRLGGANWREITWRPESLSDTFHGRDLFAPAAARCAMGEPPDSRPFSADEAVGQDWPDELAEIVYVDAFGNVMTGLRSDQIGADHCLVVGGSMIRHARTFSAVGPGVAFWYGNANGLCEIAVNRRRADVVLGVEIGLAVQVVGGRAA
jgi:S-adenosylmethionine hydrolase